MMYQDPLVTLHCADSRDVLQGMPAESVDMVMTSPPYYGLRSYKAGHAVWDSVNGCLHEWGDTIAGGISAGYSTKQVSNHGSHHQVTSNYCHLCGAWRGQLGAEPDPDLFIKHLCDIFDLVKRVLKKTGSIYVNLDDSHASGGGEFFRQSAVHFGYQENTRRAPSCDGIPAKSLIGIPERFMLEMIRRGWICRNVIIWHKRNVMPESVKDRYTIDFERIFFFSKSQRYFFERQFEPSARDWGNTGGSLLHNTGRFDETLGHSRYADGLEHGTKSDTTKRNKRAVWTVNPQGFAGPHYATYPEELCRVPIESSCPEFICTRCGKPRVKVYETTGGSTGKGWTNHINDGEMGMEQPHKIPNEFERNYVGLSDCGCNAPFEPGIVLDPFSGVGTTCVMAKKLGRRSIGIEISEKYHQLAIKRIEGVVARMM